jgi:hypothetical protein
VVRYVRGAFRRAKLDQRALGLLLADSTSRRRCLEGDLKTGCCRSNFWAQRRRALKADVRAFFRDRLVYFGT